MSSPSSQSPLAEKFAKLFEAERTARQLHRELVATSGHVVVKAVRHEIDALGKLAESERSLRLVRLCSILGNLSGDEPVDMLIDILNVDAPEARLAAGEALEGIAFERFKEVALGCERALARLPADSPALVELPYIVGEVAEGGVVKLLGLFLKAKEADVVAAAIEALVEIEDPAGIPLLKPLQGDGRMVELEEEADAVSIGSLASEACEILEGSEG